MTISSRHRNGRLAPRTEANRRGWRCCGIGAGIGASAIAQLSIAVRSPTLQVAVVENGASVTGTSRHRNGRSATAEVDGGG